VTTEHLETPFIIIIFINGKICCILSINVLDENRENKRSLPETAKSVALACEKQILKSKNGD